MDAILQQAQVYQVLALNEEMLKNGYISRQEYEFVRRLQVKKLTDLHHRGIIKEQSEHLA